MLRSGTQNRRLVLERLEDRVVLAGNVTATLVDDTLTIVGDQLGNEISITQSGTDVVISGLPGTTVSGAATIPALDILNVLIQLNSGNDNVEVIDLDLSGNLSINTANGSDVVTITEGSLILGGDLSIRTGNGNDTVSLAGTIEASNLTIETGNGDDNVTILTGESFLPTPGPVDSILISGSTTLDGGRGVDRLAMRGFFDSIHFEEFIAID